MCAECPNRRFSSLGGDGNGGRRFSNVSDIDLDESVFGPGNAGNFKASTPQARRSGRGSNFDEPPIELDFDELSSIRAPELSINPYVEDEGYDSMDTQCDRSAQSFSHRQQVTQSFEQNDAEDVSVRMDFSDSSSLGGSMNDSRRSNVSGHRDIQGSRDGVSYEEQFEAMNFSDSGEEQMPGRYSCCN